MGLDDLLIDFVTNLAAAAFWAAVLWLIYTRDRKSREDEVKKGAYMRLNLGLRGFIKQVEERKRNEYDNLEANLKSELDKIPDLKKRLHDTESILDYMKVGSERDDRDKAWGVICNVSLETWLIENDLLNQLDKNGKRWDQYAEYIKDLQEDLKQVQNSYGTHLPLETISRLVEVDTTISYFFRILSRYRDRDEYISDILTRFLWAICKNVLSLREEAKRYASFEIPSEGEFLLRGIIATMDRKGEIPALVSAAADSSLIEHYRLKYPHNPEGVLAFHIDRLEKEGKTGNEAILELKRQSGIGQ